MTNQQKGLKPKYRVLAVAVFSLIVLILGAGNSWAAATYSSTTGVLHIPAVDIQGSGAYDVDLLLSGSNPGGFQVNMEFVLQSGTLNSIVSETPSVYTTDGKVHIPVLAANSSGTTQYYDVELEIVPGTNPLKLKVSKVSQAHYATGNIITDAVKMNTALGISSLTVNTTGIDNTATGQVALHSNTTGNYNTANGMQSLYSNTTGTNNTANGVNALYSNITGNYNTASGMNALFSNTTGYNNTASGMNALYYNTTGNYNTASGGSALYSNVSGNNNTASGQGALYFNTTGNNNTASGAYTLVSNTTGDNNTSSGMNALFSNTTGNSNTASGAYALASNTTGNSNAASGEHALSSNITGDGNTASGGGALRSSTTGGWNTASGLSALRSNTAGDANTAIGAYSLSLNTTGINNTALGSNAGLYATGSNNIYLGANVSGVAADTSTTRIGLQGTQTQTFISGISGVTSAGAAAVYINGSGQLGTVVSSRRFKEDIKDMGEASSDLMKLRPVTFLYKPEVATGERILQYGLIAEEVAEVYPDLVQYSATGEANTVYYHLVNAMLLNEVQKQNKQIAALQERLSRIEALINNR